QLNVAATHYRHEDVLVQRNAAIVSSIAEVHKELFRQPEYLCRDLCYFARCKCIGNRQIIRIANELVDQKIRNLYAEIIRRDVFDQMCFVKDHRTVIRNYLAVLSAANVQVGEEKVMIYDDNIGGIGSGTHSGNETRFEIGAFLADARFRTRVYAVPEWQVFG